MSYKVYWASRVQGLFYILAKLPVLCLWVGQSIVWYGHCCSVVKHYTTLHYTKICRLHYTTPHHCFSTACPCPLSPRPWILNKPQTLLLPSPGAMDPGVKHKKFQWDTSVKVLHSEAQFPLYGTQVSLYKAQAPIMQGTFFHSLCVLRHP